MVPGGRHRVPSGAAHRSGDTGAPVANLEGKGTDRHNQMPATCWEVFV